jgi:Leu/Phe-tRNA-protein transferase
MEENYYAYEHFSPSIYILLAKAGFITTTATLANNKKYLLPEIQFQYAVLYFENIHISRKVNKLLKRDDFVFVKNRNLNLVIDSINDFHKDSWINEEYKNMLLEIFANSYDNFELLSFELYDKSDSTLIAAEIGYKIGKVYTSLTGFSKREKRYNNYGKLQLILLSNYLQKNDYKFWNLGHACLQYKIDLGAIVLKRDEFLEQWLKYTKLL